MSKKLLFQITPHVETKQTLSALESNEGVTVCTIEAVPDESISTAIQRIQDKLEEIEAYTYRDLYIPLDLEHQELTHILSHECMQKFADRVTFIAQPEHLQEKQFDMEPYLEKEQLFHICRDLIVTGNYGAVRQVLHPRPMGKELYGLLALADALFRYTPEDMEQRFELLATILERNNADPNTVAFCREMKALCRQDAKSLLFYLHNIAEFYFEQEQLIEFFVYFYRLIEEWVLFALGWGLDRKNRLITAKERKIRIPLPSNPPQTYLHHYLRILRNEIRNMENKYRVRITRTSSRQLRTLSERDRLYIELYMFLTEDNFSDLLELRHEGVSGHGFEDFTIEECLKLCKGVPPIEKINPLLERWGLLPSGNIIRSLNSALLSVLDEEIYQGA